MIYMTDMDPRLFTLLTLKTIAAKYTTPIDLPDDALCLFCRRTADNILFDVYKKHEIISILDILSIEYKEDPALVDYICYVCVFRFSIVIDFRNLVNNTYNKSRANYYFNIGDKDKCMQFLSRKKSTSSRINNQNSNNENNTTTAAATAASSASVSNSRIVNGFLDHNNENYDEIINGSSSPYCHLHINEDNYAVHQDYLFNCLQYVQNIIPGRLSETLKEIDITFTRTPRDSTLPTEIISTTISPPSTQQSSINTVPLPYATTSQQQQQQQTTSSIDTSMKNVAPSSPQGLEILYEGSPHPVLATESGHANEQYDENILLKPYECEMCLKRFARSRLLRKHQRQHYNNNNIDDGGNNSSQQQKRGRKRKRRYSVTTKSLATSSHHRTIIHYCDICNITFENLKLYKKHNRETHERIYKCTHCTDSFCCRADWELHEAICYGKKLAEIDNNTENVNGKTEGRIYQTRSRRSTIIATTKTNDNDNNSKRSKRTIDYNESNKDSDEEEIEEIDSLYNEKVRSVNDWVENQIVIQKQREERLQKLDNDENDKCQDTSSSVNFSQSDISSISRDSSLSRNSSVMSRESSLTRASTPLSYYSSLTRLNVSQSGSSRRNTRTPRSSRRGRIRRRTINALSENQQREVYTSLEPKAEFGVPIEITYPQLVYPKQFQLFRCPENGCDFVHQSLNRLMHHDIECHNQLPLFYCKICKFRFIRRFYYEQHLMFQCYGWHFCFKCDKRFDYLYALKEHLNLHKITIPHKCTICNLSFLTQNNLDEHLLSDKHKKTVINKPPRIVFERYDYNVGNNESNNKNIENENEQQQEEEEEELQQIEENQLQQKNDNQNNEENLSQQQQQTNEKEDQTNSQDHTQNERIHEQQMEEINQDDTQNNENDKQKIQEGQENQNDEQQLQVQKTTKQPQQQQQQGTKRPLPSSSSSSAPPYKSIIKILKLVDTERSNDREVLTWYPGIVFELNNENSQNCALQSTFPRRVFLNQN